MSDRVRVLVVDDSALMRKLIPQILHGDESIEVVGTAMDGEFALKKIEELKPDVVTLDLEMPRLDGIETLRAIMRKFQLPVIVVSAHTMQGAYSTFKALSQGAFDFVAKPRDAAAGHLEEIAAELAAKIKAASRARIPKMREQELAQKRPGAKSRSKITQPPNRVVAIGVSTGGPLALQYVFAQLPADFAGSILIVQHMPEGFTEMFAKRLDDLSCIEVHEAKSGDLLRAGRALVCPGNRHMVVRRMPRGDMVVLSDTAPVNGHRPSADVLFQSVAREIGANAIGVIMTGMGDDGAEGLGAIQSAGGLTIAQSEDSCVVSSMPRAAILKGFATRIVSLEGLANLLQHHCSSASTRPATTEVPSPR